MTLNSDGFELGICVTQDQCLRPLNSDDIRVQLSRLRSKLFQKIFKSPYCDVGSYKVETLVYRATLN